MLEKLAKARNLSKANKAINRLISERGESNAVSMANDVVNNYRKLSKDQHVQFFTFLFEKLNPQAEVVMKAAQNYAAEASARNYIQLQKVIESPRQEESKCAETYCRSWIKNQSLLRWILICDICSPLGLIQDF